MNPSDEQLLSAFHDGEAAAPAVSTPEANRYLGELAEMSALFQKAVVPGLTPAAWNRIHRQWDGVDRSLLRLGWRVSALAASVLIIGSVWLARVDGGTADVSVPPWVGAQATVDPATRESATPAAAWYLADARTGTDLGQ